MQGSVRWGRNGHPAGTWPGSDWSCSLSRLVGVGGHGDGGHGGGEGEEEMERARVSDGEVESERAQGSAIELRQP